MSIVGPRPLPIYEFDNEKKEYFDWGDIPFDVVGFYCGLAIAWMLKF